MNDAGHPWTITTGAHGPEFRLYYTLLGAGVTSPLSLEATVNLCNGIILINGEMDQNFIRHEYHSRFNE